MFYSLLALLSGERVRGNNYTKSAFADSTIRAAKVTTHDTSHDATEANNRLPRAVR
jgi:hypothetical protein